MKRQVELSQEARELCASLFPHGASSSLTSTPPHAEISGKALAMDQLVRAGVVKLHREGLTFIYTGTLRAGQIARQVAAEARR